MDRVRKSLGTLLRPDRVVDLAPGETKRDVVHRLGVLTCRAAAVHGDHEKAVLDALWDRETILSTGIGLGMAVPHVRHSNVATEAMFVGRSAAGLAFDAIDGKPVHAVFTILLTRRIVRSSRIRAKHSSRKFREVQLVLLLLIHFSTAVTKVGRVNSLRTI